ncbi:MAG TPA: GTPase domain-containing protein [Candidatus Angelobacter sp.]|jgi:hypothetical protein|nr:GTPase domain-containing protein [Candidatus Angelobacter sp.]
MMAADQANEASAAVAAVDPTDDSSVAGSTGIPVLSKEDMENNVLVGVCGAQAAGKTVFLASIFHTITGTVVEGVGRMASDRKAGGAQYFQLIENTILDQNQAIPTRESAVARLIATTAHADNAQSETGIMLFDFAGGYFTAFADIKAAKQDASDAQTKQDIDHVADYLEKCDAFILLIDSSQFRRDAGSKTAPFSPSVLHIIDHCATRRKPIALVFTKRDMNPTLTLETILSFTRVQQFVNRFSSDRSQDDKPFGMVALLAAYEHEEFSTRVRRHQDNTIWLQEPTKVFSKVIQAAWPAATLRLRQAIEETRRKERELAEAKRIKEKGKRLGWSIALGAIAFLILGVLVMWLWNQHDRRQTEVESVNQIAELLRQGQPERVDGSQYSAFLKLEASHDDASADTAWNELEKAFRKTLQKLPVSVYDGPAQGAAAESLLRLSDLAGLQESEVLNLLRLHHNIRDAAGSCKPPEAGARLAALSSVPTTANGQRNPAFITALIAEAASLRAVCAGEMVEPGKTRSTLAERIGFIRERLAENGRQQMDPRWKTALSRAYVKLLGASLTGLTARNNMVELLKASPALKPLLDTTNNDFVQLVRYRFITEAIGKLDAGGLETLRSGIEPLLKKFASNDESEALALEDTLQRLFEVETNESCDCQSLWRGLFEGADSEYLFVLSMDAWPSGYSPWKDELLSRLKSANYSKDETRLVISEISKKPMYWREVEGITGLANDRHLGFESTRLYNEAVQRLGNGGVLNMRDSARPIRQIAFLAGSIHDAHARFFGTDSDTFRLQHDAATQLAERLESPYSVTDSSSTLDAAHWLREYCESQLRGYRAHCAN